MTGILLKLKSKNGQHVVNNLDANTTIGLLKTRISEVTKIPEAFLHVLVGFPPKPLDLSNDTTAIGTSGIHNGDTLIVEEKNTTQGLRSGEEIYKKNLEQADATLAQQLAAEEEQRTGDQQGSSGAVMGILLKKVVPADNSCLFTSIGYVLNGEVLSDCGVYMRNIIAEHVSSDPVTYNEAMLGKPNSEYCSWIRRAESWGGAIEISILSNFYGIEIDVVDITNAIINRFGEDKNYGQRVFLLFDGIHYDPLYMESLNNGSPQTIFPIENENVYNQAQQLAREAKSSRQFTDVNKFTLQCIQCNAFLTGQVEAQQHAIKTGHVDFGEV